MNEAIVILIVLMPLIFIFLGMFAKKKKTQSQVEKFQDKESSHSKSSNLSSPQSSGTIAVEKSKLSISIIAILFFIAVISIITMSFFIDKKFTAIFYTLGSILFIPIGIAIGAIFSSNIRIKIIRALTKKNIGIVKFVISGKIVKPVIANLDNDIIRFGNGIYIVNKEWIKRETIGEEEYSFKKIDQNKIKYEEGIPTIYFDIDDIMPIDFDITNKNIIEKYRIPSQVSATLNKEIAVEKAKIMNAFGTRQNIFMLVVIAGVMILLYFALSSNNLLKDLKKIADSSKNEISNINSRIDALEKDLKTQEIIMSNSTYPIPLLIS